MMAALLRKLRPVTPPLEPIRATSEILSDLDIAIGRLQKVRERAVELVERVNE